MRREKRELVRVQTIIENDRLNMGDNFEELIVYDLHKILKDYFDYKGLPSIKILKRGNNLDVQVLLKADAVRLFNTVPKN